MKRQSKSVVMPRMVVESLAKTHPELSIFIPQGMQKHPVLSRQSIQAVKNELLVHKQALIRCSAKSHWEPKVVPLRFYDVKLHYPMNDSGIQKKAVARAREVREASKQLVAA